MELGIQGRVALVTGGSKGIGRAVAAGLAGEGCRVAIAARGADALHETAEALSAKGGEVISPAADLTEPDAPRRVIEAVVARFGRLEILVNNAGAIRGGDFLTTPAETWADDWRLKILGYVRMAQAAIPVMRTGHWGRIINIIGAAARNPATTYMAGGIANAGLINFTRALADLGAPDGILVNAEPLPTATSGGPSDRPEPRRRGSPSRPPRRGRAEQPRDASAARKSRPRPVPPPSGGFPDRGVDTVDGGASRGVTLREPLDTLKGKPRHRSRAQSLALPLLERRSSVHTGFGEVPASLCFAALEADAAAAPSNPSTRPREIIVASSRRHRRARGSTDQFTGRPKGFGFVEMATPEEASRAVDQLNGRVFRDRNLVVDQARSQGPGGGGGGRPRDDRRGPGGGGGRGGYNR